MGPLVQRDLGQMPLLPIRDKAALRIDSVEIKIVQHLSFIGEVAFRLSFYFIFPFIGSLPTFLYFDFYQY